MDAEKILADLRICRKTLELLTNPVVASHLGSRGWEEKRTQGVSKLEKRVENLEFAYEMISHPVLDKEPT